MPAFNKPLTGWASLLLLALVCAAGYGTAALAAEQTATGVVVAPGKAFKAFGDTRANSKGSLLQRTLINTGSAGLSQTSGTQNLDAVTPFNCTDGSGKCTYTFQAAVQYHNVTADNAVGFCFMLDELVVGGICRFSTGAAEVTPSFQGQVFGFAHQFDVSRGPHTVRTRINSTGVLGSVGFYELTYRSFTKTP